MQRSTRRAEGTDDLPAFPGFCQFNGLVVDVPLAGALHAVHRTVCQLCLLRDIYVGAGFGGEFLYT